MRRDGRPRRAAQRRHSQRGRPPGARARAYASSSPGAYWTPQPTCGARAPRSTSPAALRRCRSSSYAIVTLAALLCRTSQATAGERQRVATADVRARSDRGYAGSARRCRRSSQAQTPPSARPRGASAHRSATARRWRPCSLRRRSGAGHVPARPRRLRHVRIWWSARLRREKPRWHAVPHVLGGPTAVAGRRTCAGRLPAELRRAPRRDLARGAARCRRCAWARRARRALVPSSATVPADRRSCRARLGACGPRPRWAPAALAVSGVRRHLPASAISPDGRC